MELRATRKGTENKQKNDNVSLEYWDLSFVPTKLPYLL